MAAENKMAKGLMVGFLTGTIVGGVIALLYAPKSGKELREDLKKKSEEITADVENYLIDAQTKAKQLINEGKDKSAHLISEAKQKADSLLKDAESLLHDAKKRMNDESSKVKIAMKAGLDAYKEEKHASPDRES